MSLIDMSTGTLGKCNDRDCTKGCGIFVPTRPPPLHFQTSCAICGYMAGQHCKQLEFTPQVKSLCISLSNSQPYFAVTRHKAPHPKDSPHSPKPNRPRKLPYLHLEWHLLIPPSNWCVHGRHQKVVCECNYKWKTGVGGVHKVTSNSMGVCVLIWLV